MTMAALDNEIDLAQAEADLKALGNNPDESALRAALDRITGGESSKVAATNGADQWVTLYHRYDGREHPVPRYMVPKLLTARLLPDNDLYPREAQGQQAWSLKPEECGYLKAEYGPFDVSMGLPCYFSSAQADPRILADRTGAGIPAFCRKFNKQGTPVLFSDALNLASHHKKHRNALPTFEKFRAERRERDREEQSLTSASTMEALVRTLMGQQQTVTASAPVVAVSADADLLDAGLVDALKGTTAAPAFICDICGTGAKSLAGLGAHKRSHKE